MGFIREDIELLARKRRREYLPYLTLGHSATMSDVNFDEQTVDGLGYHIFEGTHRVILANGDIAVGERIRFREVKIKGRKVTEPQFVVLDSLVEDVTIGVHLMRKIGITLDPAREMLDLR